jgi:hypothetical protein
VPKALPLAMASTQRSSLRCDTSDDDDECVSLVPGEQQAYIQNMHALAAHDTSTFARNVRVLCRLFMIITGRHTTPHKP